MFHLMKALVGNFNVLYLDHSLRECIRVACSFEPVGVYQKPPIIIWNRKMLLFPSRTLWVNAFHQAHDEVAIGNTLYKANDNIHLPSKVGLGLSSTCH